MKDILKKLTELVESVQEKEASLDKTLSDLHVQKETIEKGIEEIRSIERSLQQREQAVRDIEDAAKCREQARQAIREADAEKAFAKTQIANNVDLYDKLRSDLENKKVALQGEYITLNREKAAFDNERKDWKAKLIEKVDKEMRKGG